MRATAVVPVALAASVTLALAGCSTASDATADDTLSVVASTDVYGDIAARIAGDAADVTSIITGAVQDPHSYEATARDQLAVAEADLVIENGGGYDAFMDTLLDASGTSALVLNASEISGLIEGDEHDHEAEDADDEHTEDEGDDHSEEEGDDHADEGDEHDHEHIEGFNEHVWYSFHAMEHLAEEIAEHLAELDPANAETFDTNLDGFLADLESLEAEAEALHTEAEGLSVAITEPVPLYLLEAVGLTNVTPDAFSEAIEEGDDLAPAVLQETLEIIEGGDVALLAYNSQTAGAETELVAEAATEAGVPLVEFTETLPEGADYVSWMSDNIAAIRAALTA